MGVKETKQLEYSTKDMIYFKEQRKICGNKAGRGKTDEKRKNQTEAACFGKSATYGVKRTQKFVSCILDPAGSCHRDNDFADSQAKL